MDDAKIINTPNNLRKAKVGTGRAKLDMKALKKADPTPDSDSKLETAVKYVGNRINESGLPKMGADALAELIESRLGCRRGDSACWTVTGTLPDGPRTVEDSMVDDEEG